jgi:hypothetical protein
LHGVFVWERRALNSRKRRLESGGWRRPAQVLLRVDGAFAELVSNDELQLSMQMEFADAAHLLQFPEALLARLGVRQFQCSDMIQCITRPGLRGVNRPDGLLNRPAAWYDMLFAFFEMHMTLSDIDALWSAPIFRVRGPDGTPRLMKLADSAHVFSALPTTVSDDLLQSNAFMILLDVPRSVQGAEFLQTVGIVPASMAELFEAVLMQHMKGELACAEAWAGLSFLKAHVMELVSTRRAGSMPQASSPTKHTRSWKQRAMEIVNQSRQQCFIGGSSAERPSDEATFRELQTVLCAPGLVLSQ